MDFLQNLLKKAEPAAKKNKYAHTLYDALATFLFQPGETTRGNKLGVHARDGMDLKRTMFHVVIAMQLALVIGILNIGQQHYVSLGFYPGILDGIGWKMLYGLGQILPLIIVVHVAGLGVEIIFAAIKGHQVEEGFLVSGMLIPLIMPPDVPLWMVAVATIFAVIIAKEAFGGTGMNILNIALTARVFIFFAYPTEISGDFVWVSYDYNILHWLTQVEAHDMNMLAELRNIDVSVMGENGVRDWVVDGYSGATPLALAKEGGWEAVQAATYPVYDYSAMAVTGAPAVEHVQQYSLWKLILGFMPGSIGETSKALIIAGAGLLIASGIGSWRIMISMIAGLAFAGVSMNILGAAFAPDATFIGVPWYYHYLIGSFFFAMAFMATDPVTAAGTDMGKFIYGFLIGVVGLIIRVTNPAYPEGWMLAILFLNVFAPLIDYFVIQANIKRRLARVV